MRSACPYCFVTLPEREAMYRCTSGANSCMNVADAEARALHGYDRGITPFYRVIHDSARKGVPRSIVCRRCSSLCDQQICPNCHADLPPNWRDEKVFTMTVTGARGSGKSVYIAVMVAVLRSYLERRKYNMTAVTVQTEEGYRDNYYRELFENNRVLEGTPPMAGGGAYQREPLMWRIDGAKRGHFTLVLRDVAGEDIERLAGERPEFSFFDRADLTVFLFDPLMLDRVRQALDGIIPDIDAGRLGLKPGEALEKVLRQLTSGYTRLALTVSKFDSLQQVAHASHPTVGPALATMGSHLNRDDTMERAGLDAKQAAKDLAEDIDFLDAEVSSLFALLNEEFVSDMSATAVEGKKIKDLRRFAVSSLGETPAHASQLTERGITPFRVLDPVLWGIAEAGFAL